MLQWNAAAADLDNPDKNAVVAGKTRYARATQGAGGSHHPIFTASAFGPQQGIDP